LGDCGYGCGPILRIGGNVPQVTAIKAQQRRRDRANIYLDGEYAFSLQKILAAELVRDQELTAQEIAELRARDLAERAYERSLRYLSYRPRSEQEMRRYLENKDVEPDVITQVIDRLRRMRLIDDAAFAEFWVENRENFRPRGAWALRGELRQKGVPSDLIEGALSDLDEESAALRASEQVVRRYARLDHDTFLRRFMGYLQRRGFPYGLSRRIVEQRWAELQQDGSGENGS
jgi:regulatory protein